MPGPRKSEKTKAFPPCTYQLVNTRWWSDIIFYGLTQKSLKERRIFEFESPTPTLENPHKNVELIQLECFWFSILLIIISIHKAKQSQEEVDRLPGHHLTDTYIVVMPFQSQPQARPSSVDKTEALDPILHAFGFKIEEVSPRKVSGHLRVTEKCCQVY